MTIAQLERVLNFVAPDAIAVFRRSFDIPLNEAELLFKETLKWLWLGCYHKTDSDKRKPIELSIFPSIVVLDEMWHSFILCSRQYHEFSDKYFGSYVHHEPFVGDTDENEDRKLITQNIDYVIRNLGPETATLWYGVYTIKYSPQQLCKLRRKA